MSHAPMKYRYSKKYIFLKLEKQAYQEYLAQC